MGEIAEMMLEGAMCQWCGEMIDNECGYPTICRGCQRQHNVDEFGQPKRNGKNKGQSVKSQGATMPRLNSKLHARLTHIKVMSDGRNGMYSGDHWSNAITQHTKLLGLGYVDMYIPHNPVHKERAVITERGRHYLEMNK